MPALPRAGPRARRGMGTWTTWGATVAGAAGVLYAIACSSAAPRRRGPRAEEAHPRATDVVPDTGRRGDATAVDAVSPDAAGSPGSGPEPEADAEAAGGKPVFGSSISYLLRRHGKISLAVYDQAGVQVRTLLNAEPQAKGRHSVAWDGLDLEGRPVPPGEYTWRLLAGPGVRAEYLMSIGTSAGIHHWPGQHGGPNAIACDGKDLYVGGMPEGSPLIVKVGLDNTYRYAVRQLQAGIGTADMALGEDALYALQRSGSVYVLDQATGARRLDFAPGLRARALDPIPATSERSVTVTVTGLEDAPHLLRVKGALGEGGAGRLHCTVNGRWTGLDGIAPGGEREFVAPQVYGSPEPVSPKGDSLVVTFVCDGLPEGGTWRAPELELLAPATRIDACDDALAALFPAAQSVAWLDPASGKVLAQVAVKGARDVALVDRSTALVVTARGVLEMTRAGRVTPLVRGLVSGHRVSVDRASGSVWVAERGASQQVKRFTRSGRLEATFGRAGGRRSGLYRPGDFLAVEDVVADGHAGFLVCEADSAPRRTARFDSGGRPVREWFGGQQFYTFATPEEGAPSLVWMDSQWGWVMQAEVDWKGRAWRPRARYPWASELDPRMVSHGRMAGRFYAFRADLAAAGKPQTYLWFQGKPAMLLRVDEEAGVLRPVALLATMEASSQTKVLPLGAPAAGTSGWEVTVEATLGVSHGNDSAVVEVLDAAGQPIAGVEYYRGDARETTTPSGHTNYVLFNGRELAHAGAGWKEPAMARPVVMRVKDGRAAVEMADGDWRLERPALAGSDWRRPAACRLRTVNTGRIAARSVRIAWGSDGREGRASGDPASVPWETDPRSFGEALRALGQDADDPDVRRRYAAFGWADADLDGEMEPQELRLTPGAEGAGRACGWLDAKSFGIYSATAGEGMPSYRFRPPAARTPTGLPVWTWDAAVTEGPALAARGSRMLRARGGFVYQLLNGGGDGFAGGLDSFHAHGPAWPGTLTDRTAFVKCGPDGRVLWRVGPHAARYGHPPGQVHYPTAIAGFAKGCVGVTDYFVHPCHFWSEDGLYLGTLFDGRADDGLPDRVYSWWKSDRQGPERFEETMALFQYDMLVGGSLAELPDGSVVFTGAGWNNVPAYRVHGLDNPVREEGTVTVARAAPAASGAGTGLLAEYFSDRELTTPAGAPAQQVAAGVWFGSGKPWPADGISSARWTGRAEPRFGEAYTFAVYASGGSRLRVGGRLLVDAWDEGGKHFSAPVRLSAGRKYPIELEWRATGGEREVHLSWESASQGIEHVPASALYPRPIDVGLPRVEVKAAVPYAVRGERKPVVFALRRSGALERALSAAYDLTGPARPGVDYVAPSGSVTFGPGEAEALVEVRPLEPETTAALALSLELRPSDAAYLAGERAVAGATLNAPPGTRVARIDELVRARGAGAAETRSLGAGGPAESWTLDAALHLNVAHGGNRALFEILDAAGAPIVAIHMYRGDREPGVADAHDAHETSLVFNGRMVICQEHADWSQVQGRRFPLHLEVAGGRVAMRYGPRLAAETPSLGGDWRRPAAVHLTSNADTADVWVKDASVTLKCQP